MLGILLPVSYQRHAYVVYRVATAILHDIRFDTIIFIPNSLVGIMNCRDWRQWSGNPKIQRRILGPPTYAPYAARDTIDQQAPVFPGHATNYLKLIKIRNRGITHARACSELQITLIQQSSSSGFINIEDLPCNQVQERQAKPIFLSTRIAYIFLLKMTRPG